MLKLDYVLFTVNYFKATIRMKLPYVTCVKPFHSSLINLFITKKLSIVSTLYIKLFLQQAGLQKKDLLKSWNLSTLYTSFVFPSFLKYPTVTFGPPITISPRGIGESVIKYPPSGQSINWKQDYTQNN